MRVKSVNFTGAVALLEGVNPTVIPEQTKEPEESGELKPYKGSYEKFKVQSEWLQNRIGSEDIVNRYGVFQYNNPARRSAYSNKVLLPIKGHTDGQIYGYLGRSIDGTEPKENIQKDRSLSVTAQKLVAEPRAQQAVLS